MALTDTAIRNAKPCINAKGEQTTKPYSLYDVGGLYLEVMQTGGKLWRFKYRFAGKQTRMSLGNYPDTGLKDAREKRDAARKLLAAGIDPSEHRKAAKSADEEKAANSFEVVARSWLATQKRTLEPVTLKRAERMLELWAFPWLGGKPVTLIKPPDILRTLKRVEMRGALQPAISTPRAAIIDPVRVGELLRAIDGFSGTFATGAALKLAPVLFVRPGELRAAEWTELDLDAERPIWVIQAPKRKLRRAQKENPNTPPHIVPLPRQALHILHELKALTGSGKYLFPGARSPRVPMSNMTLNAALRRMGYDRNTMTAHGFRAMASTLLNELGWNPDAIERQLSHVEKNKVRAAYNRAGYMDERMEMMQAWANYLETLKLGGNVLALHSKHKRTG